MEVSELHPEIKTNEMRYPQGGPVVKSLAVGVFLICTGALAFCWAEKAEPWFGKVAGRIEKVMIGVTEPRSPKGILGEVRKE